MRRIQHAGQLRLIHVLAAQKDIVAQGFVEQRGILRHHRKEPAECREVQILRCDPVDPCGPALRVDQPGQDVEDRALARA